MLQWRAASVFRGYSRLLFIAPVLRLPDVAHLRPCTQQGGFAQVVIAELSTQVERIRKLFGIDAGFYLLAIHSCIEAWLREAHPDCSAEKFAELISNYRNKLIKTAQGGFIRGLEVLKLLVQQHLVANAVRHRFQVLDGEEAIAATNLFLRFCRLAGLDSSQVQQLRSFTDRWKERDAPLEQAVELRRLENSLRALQAENQTLLEQHEQYSELLRQHGQLEQEAIHLTNELSRREATDTARKQKVDKLRQERAQLRERQQQLARELHRYNDLENYIQYLERFTSYTRTRFDYERAMTTLTKEQQEVVDTVKPDNDFLIRGGPGTGKTLVLLEAMRKTVESGEQELDLGGPQQVQLLTYTRTLTAFNRYLSEVMGIENTKGLVDTIDGFFVARLHECLEGWDPDPPIVKRLCEDGLAFMEGAELANEIDGFLFGNDISREEYIDQAIPRSGMRRPLTRPQREQVWAAREQVEVTLIKEGLYSFNFARLQLLRWMEQHPAELAGKQRAYLFVDESQDMNAVGLKILKGFASRGLILAGDPRQTIYGHGSPYLRAGIKISGRTRILRVNFRNTCQVHELAQRFAARGGGPHEPGENVAYPFRMGPPPELFTSRHGRALTATLVQRARLCTERLGYDPENIAVLTPYYKVLTSLDQALQEAGYSTANVHDEDFDFHTEGCIRLSTLHSAKGLDFPVVLLYLPYLFVPEYMDPALEERRLRNLIYVAMTRAMDDLAVFVRVKEEGHPILGDVVRAFGGAG